jgi:hypothetical protein
MTTYGTQAAAEFLTEGASLEQLAARAPGRNLRHGSFQVILHTKIIGHTPTQPTIVDTHFW